MSCAKRVRLCLGLCLAVMFAAGFSGVSQATTPTPIPPTTLPAASATPTPVPLTAPTVIAERGDTKWEYMAMGDSITFGFMPLYKEYLEQDLGVKIIVHDWAREDQSSSAMLFALRNKRLLRQHLQEADVVTFNVPLKVFENPVLTYMQDPAACGGADQQDCLREALAAYQADVDAIIAEIVALRSPSEALIRTMDQHIYLVKEMKSRGAFDVIRTYWEGADQYLVKVAGEHHIPVAREHDAFMGAAGDEDPVEKGYMRGDAMHPSDEGAHLIADLFRELGYAYAPANP